MKTATLPRQTIPPIIQQGRMNPDVEQEYQAPSYRAVPSQALVHLMPVLSGTCTIRLRSASREIFQIIA
jgi:hypothetical protein